IPVLEETGDDAALARAWWVVSWRGGAMGDYEGSEEATRRSLEHARRAGDRAAERAALASVTGVVWGPLPVRDGFARLDEVRAQAGEDRLVTCDIDSARACLLAMAGEPLEARRTRERAHMTALDLGMPDVIGFVGQEGWLAETIIGDHAAAERIAREAYEILDRAGNKSLRSIASDQVAGSLFELGRLDEAEAFVDVSRTLGLAVDDPFQGPWHLTLG